MKRRRKILAAAFLVSLFGCEPRNSQRLAHRLPLPWGALDRPADGATIRGVTSVEGWAIAPDGVEKISIYFDRDFLTAAGYGGERPDVEASFPAEPGARFSGYYAEIDAGLLPSGRHLLTVQVRSMKGATRDIGSIAVTIEH